MNTFVNKKPVVAIDGTAGSGKGELAKKIAKILGFDHLDSGILYRIYAYEFIRQGGTLKNLSSIEIDLNAFLKKKKLNLKS